MRRATPLANVGIVLLCLAAPISIASANRPLQAQSAQRGKRGGAAGQKGAASAGAKAKADSGGSSDVGAASATGATVVVTLIDSVDSRTDPPGKQYRATVSAAYGATGLAIQRGTPATITLAQTATGRVAQLTSVTVGGHAIPILSNSAGVLGVARDAAVNSLLSRFERRTGAAPGTAVAGGEQVVLPAGKQLRFGLGAGLPSGVAAISSAAGALAPNTPGGGAASGENADGSANGSGSTKRGANGAGPAGEKGTANGNRGGGGRAAAGGNATAGQQNAQASSYYCRIDATVGGQLMTYVTKVFQASDPTTAPGGTSLPISRSWTRYIIATYSPQDKDQLDGAGGVPAGVCRSGSAQNWQQLYDRDLHAGAVPLDWTYAGDESAAAPAPAPGAPAPGTSSPGPSGAGGASRGRAPAAGSSGAAGSAATPGSVSGTSLTVVCVSQQLPSTTYFTDAFTVSAAPSAPGAPTAAARTALYRHVQVELPAAFAQYIQQKYALPTTTRLSTRCLPYPTPSSAAAMKANLANALQRAKRQVVETGWKQ